MRLLDNICIYTYKKKSLKHTYFNWSALLPHQWFFFCAFSNKIESAATLFVVSVQRRRQCRVSPSRTHSRRIGFFAVVVCADTADEERRRGRVTHAAPPVTFMFSPCFFSPLYVSRDRCPPSQITHLSRCVLVQFSRPFIPTSLFLLCRLSSSVNLPDPRLRTE